jgi:protein-disulfide isomerase
MWSILLAFLVLAQAQQNYSKPADDYLMGRPDSPVKIELFTDFQCPACRAFYLDTVTKLLSEYSAGNKVALIFRDFPLPMHPAARNAAKYAIAARSVGHDQWLKAIEYLYECQAEWSYDGRIEAVLARVLSDGDMDKLRTGFNDPAVEKAVEHTVSLGNSRSVNQTPTFFVTMGGKEQRVTSTLDYSVLKSFIDPYLK